MKHLIGGLLLAVLFFSGCSFTYTVATDAGAGEVPPDAVSLAQLQETVDGRTVLLVLRTAEEVTTEELTLARDSLRWKDEHGERQAAATQEIQRLEFREHISGALGGLLVGTALGAGIGWASEQWKSGNSDMSMPGIAVVGAGLLGGLWGTFIGAAHGTVQVYQFPPAPSADFEAVPPTSHDDGS